MIREGMFLGDRYEVISKVGTGGMSDVYKAMDHKLNRPVAIKVLKKELSEDAAFVSKFVVEAQSAAGLSHPNIVNVYDVGDESDIHYIVMELVEGITLKSYIEKKGRLSFKEAVSIAIQVAMGIEAAHNNNIIHRDIKPQNIIISRDGKVKVTDFGIARAVTSNTISATAMGSVHYTSPEQARGGFVDARSDIYSLGITLYEMVTGRVPFNSDTAVSIAIMHIQEDMIPPSRFVEDLPVSVEQIIFKCTQKSPDRRYQNVADLLLDLKRSLVDPDSDFVQLQSSLLDNPTAIMNEADLRSIKERYPELQDDENEDIAEAGYEPEEEPGEEEEVNPKLDKAIMALGIGAGVIILIILLYLGGSAIGLFKFTGGGSATENQSGRVEMIDLEGKTYDEAKKLLNDMGLGIKQVSEEESDKYPKGYIISQNIKKGDYVDKNTTIEVVVSSGATGILVPSVEGLDEQAAINRLSDYKLKAARDYKYDENVEAGQVISQSPKADEKAKEGDTVSIVISRGKESKNVNVPDLRGKTESEAKSMLESAGLKLGNVSKANNSEYSAGTVCKQSVAPGESAKSGTAINITISNGAGGHSFSIVVKNPGDASGDTYEEAVLKDANGKILGESRNGKWGSSFSGTSETQVVNLTVKYDGGKESHKSVTLDN
ncbi:MAG: Stk1 family PASTA domain-containing Ser/Thr kinase [Lachnospiraceae bacterium]|nr:Stk1 family PASTA domain-containing Ser/Thr kinase [Lachnospiraceae bacterium]